MQSNFITKLLAAITVNYCVFISTAFAEESQVGQSDVTSGGGYLYLLLALILVLLIVSMYQTYILKQQVSSIEHTQNIRLKDKDGLLAFPESVERRMEDANQQLSSLLNDALQKIVSQLSDSNQESTSLRGIVGTALKEISASVQKNNEKLQVFHSEIEQKNAELKRYRDGYDTYVVSKFLRQIISIRTLFVEELEDNSANDDVSRIISDVLEMVDDSLESVGIEAFSPKVGEDYSESYGVDDSYKRIDTDDKELHGTIASVQSEGLCVKSTANTLPEVLKKPLLQYMLSKN